MNKARLPDHQLTQFGVGYAAYVACRRCRATLKNVVAGCPCIKLIAGVNIARGERELFKEKQNDGN
jgi:hypothetical protein